MKHISRTILSLTLAVAMLCSLSLTGFAAQNGSGAVLYTNKSQLAEGLTYTNTIYTNPT